MKRLFTLIICSLVFLSACQQSAADNQTQPQTTPSNKPNQTEPHQHQINKAADKPSSQKPPTQKPTKDQTATATVIGEIRNIDKKAPHELLLTIAKDGKVNGYITVTEETHIRYTKRQTFAPVTMSELQVKQNVSIWCAGMITMIFPTKCTAKEILIDG